MTKLREDAVIGFILRLFALGLFIISLNPTAINVQEIIFGNILGIADTDMYQVTVVMVITLLILLIFWKDLLLVFLMKYKPKRWVYQANIINYYF